MTNQAAQPARARYLGGVDVRATLRAIATPLAASLSAISGVSGVALFFRWAPSLFHAMHEWLSMVLLILIALHLWRNWPAFLGYVRRRTLFAPMAAGFLVALPFAVVGGMGGGLSPGARAIRFIMRTPLANLATALETTPETLAARLRQRGYPVTSTAMTPDALASAVHRPANRVVLDLLAR